MRGQCTTVTVRPYVFEEAVSRPHCRRWFDVRACGHDHRGAVPVAWWQPGIGGGGEASADRLSPVDSVGRSGPHVRAHRAERLKGSEEAMA